MVLGFQVQEISTTYIVMHVFPVDGHHSDCFAEEYLINML